MFRPKVNILSVFFKQLNTQPTRYFESYSSTIYALSTNIKNAGSAIAVVRVAGPETMQVIDRITMGRCEFYRKNPRKAVLQNFYDANNELIDKGMLLWFPKPRSYTGEDMCELHIHGSQAVISKLLNVLAQFKGCRPAREGEFTKRALTNGKLQLIEAEGIRDLIVAKTDLQRKRALNALSGNLEGQFDEWRKSIIKFMAHLEAYIDFSEDELIDESVMLNLKQNIRDLTLKIERYIKQTKQKSDLIRDGLRIAIVGEANVGKSSLINKLCEKDLSITSPISGTTRDVVESWIDFAGYSVCFADTAGIKDLQNDDLDLVEREGIKRAIQRAKDCHIIILVIDSSKLANSNDLPVPSYLMEVIKDRNEQDLLLVVNKIDLLKHYETKKSLHNGLDKVKPNYLSCLSGEGLDQFSEQLTRMVENFGGDPHSEWLFSNERHMAHFEEVIRQLDQVMQSIDIDLAIAASHLRQASYQLACLTGNITTDDVLDVIFKDFCIGK